MNCTSWAVCGFVLIKERFTHANTDTLKVTSHIPTFWISPPKSLQPPGNAPSHNPLKTLTIIPHPGTKICASSSANALYPLQTIHFCIFYLKSVPIIWISFSSLKSHFTFKTAQTSRRGDLDPPASFPSMNELQQGCKTCSKSSCKAVIQRFLPGLQLKNMEAIENTFKYSEQGVENNIHRSSLCSAMQLCEHCPGNSPDLSDF